MNPIKDNLIKEFNLESLTEAEKEKMMLSIGGIIYENVLTRVLETMPDGDQDQFENLLDRGGSPQEIFGFLNKKVSNFEQIISEEATKFKNKAGNIMGGIGN